MTVTPNALVEQIDAWLPQLQCTQCGYPRCRAYAEALAAGRVDINRCPPGGEVTIRALAQTLETAPKPLNLEYGTHTPRTRALIDEALCIGCRKCLDVCPVDAILGARRLMHTVLAAECNGCGLCLPPCPVECIAMVPVPVPEHEGPWPEYPRAETQRWRVRAERRVQRLARRAQARVAARARPAAASAPDRERIRAEIRAAVERVKRKKQKIGQD